MEGKGVRNRLPTQQDSSMSLLPNQNSHLPMSGGNHGDSRPYAILPGGNFHSAQGTRSNSASVPVVKYHEQSSFRLQNVKTIRRIELDSINYPFRRCSRKIMSKGNKF